MSARPRDPEPAADIIERFLRARYRISSDDPGFSRRVNLWEEGYVDSVGVVEVIEFLERTFTTTIPEDALFSPDFACVDGMAAVVERSLEPRAPLTLEPRYERLSALEGVHQRRIP